MPFLIVLLHSLMVPACETHRNTYERKVKTDNLSQYLKNSLSSMNMKSKIVSKLFFLQYPRIDQQKNIDILYIYMR